MRKNNSLKNRLKLDSKYIAEQTIELAAKLDVNLWHRIMIFHEQLEIPAWLIIQNILIDHWARHSARTLVEGISHKRVLPEFVKNVLEDGSKEVKTGEALWDYLVDIYKAEYTKKKSI